MLSKRLKVCAACAICVFLTFCFINPSISQEILLDKIEVKPNDRIFDVQDSPSIKETHRSSRDLNVPKVKLQSINPPVKFNLDLEETDIVDVFKIISANSAMNIMPTPEVKGTVSLKLTDVTWDNALEAILNTRGLDYKQDGNIIIVAPIEKINFLRQQSSVLVTEVFNLKYLDSQLTQSILQELLSSQGKITILPTKSEDGWEFVGGKGETFGKQKRKTDAESKTRSNVLIVTDVPAVIEKLKEVIKKIDVRPEQILIQTKIIEVKKDKLKDMGIDWATGESGAEGGAVVQNPINQNGSTKSSIGTRSGNSLVQPYGFFPLGGTTANPVSGTSPFNSGSEVVFKKLTGSQFEIIAHILEQNAQTNTLSAPQILALNNQEATILIGTKYPILQSNITGAGSVGVTTVTLDYYQDIGIQLKVIPQIGAGNDINMIIHPAVTSYTDTVGDNKYPVILTREVETRVVMKNGETIVIGGLLMDEKIKSNSGVPGLKDIPVIGKIFRRDTVSTDKLDLLIFITAKIVKDDDSSTAQINEFESQLDK